MSEEDGAVDLVGHLALSSLGTGLQSVCVHSELSKHLHIVAKGVVVAILVLDTTLSQPINGIRVSHAQEWPRRLLEVRVVLLDSLSGNRVLEGQVDDTADDVLKMVQEVVEGNEIQFSLDVGVLRKLDSS